MILAFAGWIMSILGGAKLKFSEFNEEFLDHNMTTCINGVFILLVFMSHFNPYVRYTVSSDIFYAKVLVGKIGQLMVTTFLFYSGFGVMESIKAKGLRYITDIPRRRVWGTIWKVFLAVNIYAGLFNYNGSIKRLLLAYVGWTNIGNSNWYIFCILMLYTFTFISFYVFREKYNKAAFMLLVISIAYELVMFKIWGGQHWCYDTVPCFAMGVYFSIYKEKFISCFRNRGKTLLLLTLGILLYMISKNLLLQVSLLTKNNIWLYHSIFYVIAVLAIVFATSIFSIKNEVLLWFGTHLFSVYILQRIPMNLLRNMGRKDIYLYFLLCFIITVILAFCFDKVTGLLANKAKKCYETRA